MIIAIDGPSGSGKSTISKRLAEKLNLVYIDTGAIYRSVALIAQKQGISLDNGSALGELATHFSISFRFVNGINHVYYKGHDITDEIRSPEISMNASKVSSYPEVRKALLGIQRDLGRSHDSILEGRDIGTVIFPDAEYKFFLVASDEIRAKRRFLELQDKGLTTNLDSVKKENALRDKQDANREVAPLRKAEDAIEIDSSQMTIEDVVNTIIEFIRG